MANWAAEIWIRAERKMGGMLTAQRVAGEMNVGAKGNDSNQYQKEVRSHDVSAPKLSEMGITHSASSRAQKMAEIPDDEFESVIAEYKQAIADAVEMPQPSVNAVIADFIENDANVDRDIFGNFDHRQLYTIEMSQQFVTDVIADFAENDANADLGIFGNFDTRQLYTIWNFAKATNSLKNFI